MLVIAHAAGDYSDYSVRDSQRHTFAALAKVLVIHQYRGVDDIKSLSYYRHEIFTNIQDGNLTSRTGSQPLQSSSYTHLFLLYATGAS
jgi:hypothetical protein